MTEIPESLLRRSAEAKAKALGLPMEQVLAEMKGEIEADQIDSPPGDVEVPSGSFSPENTQESDENVGSSPASVEELVSAIAKDSSQPETKILQQAQDKADEQGTSLIEVLAEMRGSLTTQSQTLSDTAAGVSHDQLGRLAADKAGVPEVVVQRTAHTEAEKRGISPAEVLAELAGVDFKDVLEATSDQMQSEPEQITPTPETPTPATPVDEAEVTTEPKVDASTPAAEPETDSEKTPTTSAPEELIAAIVKSSGLPKELVARSAEAKSKALGVPYEQVLAEMAGIELPIASEETPDESEPEEKDQPPTPGVSDGSGASLDSTESPPPPVSIPPAVDGPVTQPEQLQPAAAAVAVEERPPPSPTGNGQGRTATIIATPTDVPHDDIPDRVRIQRLLTVVRADAIQQVKAEPTDKVTTWPHLLLVEFVALLVMTAFIVLLSVILQAPLLEAANPNLTPNPSKAPWYFLGLQELLSYFDPQIAGVTIPTLVGMVGFMMIPYIDRNPSTKPSDRKLAIMLYTIFLTGSATLTIIGVLFRGQGFNFSYPWKDGVFFDDLKDWVNFE